MSEKISPKIYLALSALTTLALSANILWWKSPVVGIAATLLYLVCISYLFGSLVTAKHGWQLLFGALLLLSVVAIFGAAAIYFYQFNNYVITLLVIVLPALLVIPYYANSAHERFSLKQTFHAYLDWVMGRREKKHGIILILSYALAALVLITLLISGSTSISIQSPWQVVSPYFIPLYFIASALLVTYLLTAQRTKLPLFFIGIHTFISTAVALLVYQIGYGFDPFIHQATEALVATFGTFSPTPLCYLGQYSLIVWLHKLSALPLEAIDRLWVPALSALLLPPTVYFVFSHWLKKNFALTLSLLILTVPYSWLIMTTPQNFANLLFIITVLLSLLYFRSQIPFWLLATVTLATTAIHPLAGIPLAITMLFVFLYKTLHTSYAQQLGLFISTALIFSLALPLAFIATGAVSDIIIPTIDLQTLVPISIIDHFDLPLNLTYFIHFNGALLGLLVVLLGAWYLRKHRLLKNHTPYIMAAVVLFISYAISNYGLLFGSIRDFDRPGFVSRISTLAFYTLMPLYLIGVYVVVKKFWHKDAFTKLCFVLVSAGALTVSLYLSFPRVNQSEPAKFYSVSDSDFEAVKAIEQIAHPEHVVLANQMVGVAAIKQFGFKKYINDEFFYSMPSGSTQQLYAAFRSMTYNGATRQTMETVLDGFNVQEAYFVLNRYWRNFETIRDQARLTADEIFIVDDGALYIFKYIRQ